MEWCGGQRTTSDVALHLLPCFRQAILLFAPVYNRLAGPRASGDSHDPISYITVRMLRFLMCAPTCSFIWNLRVWVQVPILGWQTLFSPNHFLSFKLQPVTGSFCHLNGIWQNTTATLYHLHWDFASSSLGKKYLTTYNIVFPLHCVHTKLCFQILTDRILVVSSSQ